MNTRDMHNIIKQWLKEANLPHIKEKVDFIYKFAWKKEKEIYNYSLAFPCLLIDFKQSKLSLQIESGKVECYLSVTNKGDSFAKAVENNRLVISGLEDFLKQIRWTVTYNAKKYRIVINIPEDTYDLEFETDYVDDPSLAMSSANVHLIIEEK